MNHDDDNDNDGHRKNGCNQAIDNCITIFIRARNIVLCYKYRLLLLVLGLFRSFVSELQITMITK